MSSPHVTLTSFMVGAALASAKPNILYVMTDDQDIELGGVTPMPKVRTLLGDGGAVGESFYIQTPICCPSRTETLSGRMYHNVLEDHLGGCMSVNSTGYIFQETMSLYPLLQSAGYLTAGFGKIINGQGGTFKKNIHRGFDWMSAPTNEGNYFWPEFYEVRPNGSTWISLLGADSARDDSWFQTAQIGNRSIEFIDYAVNVAKQPFAAYLGPHAPHYSADSPPWARDRFDDLEAPRTPAYNTSEGQLQKTAHIRQNPSWAIGSAMEAGIDTHFRDRWRAISGVDDMVGLLHDHLETLGVLDNTYIFLTSDHGYKLGEWRLGCSKEHPFETDVHIPFFARGPGIAPGTRITALGSNIDIAPTFIDIAGLPPHPEHDGKSLLPMLTAGSSAKALAAERAAGWRTSLMIEYFAVGTYYNDHAALWVSGPAATPGTAVVYEKGPMSNDRKMTAKSCEASELTTPGVVGEGKCWFVDSKASNNWIAIRIRNSTSNLLYVESFGANSRSTKTFTGDGVGVYKCIAGDACNWELYDYGKITSDYPNYPVMTRERWNIDNLYAAQSNATKLALATTLKAAYCDTNRLVDRMGC
jgi:N-acetylglucosamine-6-sulfatase